MKRFLLLIIISVFAFTALNAQQYSVQDLMKVRRVGDPQLSPDGKWITYTVGDVNVEANRSFTQIYAVPITGGEPRQITRGDKSNANPRWSPDGKKSLLRAAGKFDDERGRRREETNHKNFNRCGCARLVA